MKNMKSFTKAILGYEDLEKFNDFEVGVIFMERSRLNQPLPKREEFEAALNFVKDGVENLVDFDGPRIVKQVGNLSVDLLKIQLETLDRCPEEREWTYKRSLEVALENEDICDKLDFTAGKLYQLMPEYTKIMELEYTKQWLSK